jgi:pyridoxine kinase
MRVKSAAPAARIIVDPIMGDEDKGLYVDQAVAEAIAVSLVPCADIVAPNAWELARLTGLPVSGLKEALAAAHALGRPTLVSSVRVGDELGVVFAQGPQAWIARHARVPAAPRGTGDLLAAVFAAGLIQLGNPLEALAVAVGATAEAVRIAAGAEELPLAALPTSLAPAAGVTVEALDG